MKRIPLILAAGILIILQSCNTEPEGITFNVPAQETFRVLVGGTDIGHLKVNTVGDSVAVDFDYKNNGRGPTFTETIRLNADGFPVSMKINGTSTFGNEVEETYTLDGSSASWTDATGSGSTTVETPMLYVQQSGSPYSLAIAARALLNAPNNTLEVLPGGQLQMTKIESFASKLDTGEINLTTYAESGADLNPNYFALDEAYNLFAIISSRFIIIREGYESLDEELRKKAEEYSAKRYENIQSKYAHNYENNVRIQNVRVFDPQTLALTDPVSVLVDGDKIASIDAPDAGGENETVIDGNGGTLVAGLYDMHGHMGENAALLNVLAGVTSVRDMGNNNEVLDNLIEKINNGVVAGPEITRLGFIEGQSPYSSNNGILVSSEEEALAAVDTYAETGNFYGVKLYNSMNGDWAPAIVEHAREKGFFVTGHVPAFSNANSMIRAGFDEMTHINQVMLGWVLEPEEDTRTLLRLTALQRLPGVEMSDPKVQETIKLMVDNKVAMDPTLGIHEALLLSRNGETWSGVVDYVDHMPPNVQRGYKEALAGIANEEEDQNYRGAYDKIIETLKTMRENEIFIVPGTDMGGAFTLHRELELYQQLGYTPAELLKLGSYDMSMYLGKEDLGSIEPGKTANFFLVPGDPTQDIKAIKTISMVSNKGVIYFPTEVYPEFGIKPFTEVPAVTP